MVEASSIGALERRATARPNGIDPRRSLWRARARSSPRGSDGAVLHRYRLATPLALESPPIVR